MKKFFSFLFLFCLCASGFTQRVSAEFVPDQLSAEFAPDQLIVKFKGNIAKDASKSFTDRKFYIADLDALNQKYGLIKIKMTGNKKKKDAYLLRFQPGQNIGRLMNEYGASRYFEWVEPNYIGHGGGVKGLDETIPDDSFFSRQWGLMNDGSFSLSPSIDDADVDMELAWDIETGSSSVIVAVLDSGFKLDHPEMSNRIWSNTAESENGSDDDTNGYIDDIRGWDFVNNDNDPTDDHGHGTNVAGILAANGDNDLGYAGIDWNCQVMIGKILNSNNSGFYSDWTDAIYYATDNGAKVINMSVGGSGFSNLMRDAATYAHDNGVTILCSMMNFDTEETYYPAGYTTTMAIGSTDPNDNRTSPFFWSATSGSSYGNHIDVVAPGNYIYGLSYSSNTNFGSYWGGTSQSTPLVAGVVSLLIAQDPARSPNQLREIIRNTSEDGVGNTAEDTPGWDKYYGAGRVNAFQALNSNIVSTKDVVKNSFSIYPNPAVVNEKINISLSEDTIEETTITIFNQIGQVLTKYNPATGSKNMEITLPSLSPGTYILKIQKGNNILSKTLNILPSK